MLLHADPYPPPRADGMAFLICPSALQQPPVGRHHIELCQKSTTVLLLLHLPG